MSQHGNLDPELAEPLLTMRHELQATGIALRLNRKKLVEELERIDQMLNETTKALEAVSNLLNVFDVPMPDYIPF